MYLDPRLCIFADLLVPRIDHLTLSDQPAAGIFDPYVAMAKLHNQTLGNSSSDAEQIEHLFWDVQDPAYTRDALARETMVTLVTW